MTPLRNAGGTIMVVLAIVFFAVATYLCVDYAGGDYAPDNSNTPNAVVPGPPAFR